MFRVTKLFLRLLWLLSFGAVLLWAEVVHVGYDARLFQVFSERDMEVATRVWVKEIIKDVHEHTFTFKFYDDIDELAADVAEERVDYIVSDGLSFVRHFDLSKLTDGFNGGSEEKRDSVYVVVVRRDGDVSSWKALEGYRIALQQHDPVAERYIRYRMRQQTGAERITIEHFRKRDRILHKLFFGQVDAAVVPKRAFELAVEMNPQVAERIEIFETTDLPSFRFGLFRKSMDPELKEEIIDLAITIDKDERGRQLLAIYQTEKLIMTRIEDLAPIQKLDADYEALLSDTQGDHP